MMAPVVGSGSWPAWMASVSKAASGGVFMGTSSKAADACVANARTPVKHSRFFACALDWRALSKACGLGVNMSPAVESAIMLRDVVATDVPAFFDLQQDPG